jgi:hypothetical protein
MIRTQIQLPDSLYSRLKDLAAKEEMSLAEVMRRAGEYFLALYPEVGHLVARWEPPQPVDMGMIMAPESEWRTLANEPTDEERSEEAG